jgi:hypothetical protein
MAVAMCSRVPGCWSEDAKRSAKVAECEEGATKTGRNEASAGRGAEYGLFDSGMQQQQ